MTLFQEISALPTIGAVIKHAEASATMLTIHRDGSFTAFYDDTETDRRLIVDYVAGRPSVDIRQRHGYDVENHCWQVEGNGGRREFPNRRGISQTVKIYRKLAEELKGYFPGCLGLYRDSRRQWYAV